MDIKKQLIEGFKNGGYYIGCIGCDTDKVHNPAAEKLNVACEDDAYNLILSIFAKHLNK